MKTILKLLVLSLFLFNGRASAQHSVDLTVNEPTGPKVKLYRDGSLLTTIVVTTPPTTYHDGSVSGGSTHTYTASNVDVSGVDSVLTASVTAVIPPDVPPPAPQCNFTIAPMVVKFIGIVGGTNPTPQSVQVGDDCPSGVHTPFTFTKDASWLTVTSNGPQTAAVLNVSVDITGMTSSPPNGHIVISGPAANSPQTVLVTVTLSAPPVQTITTACPTTTNATSNCTVKGINHGQTFDVQVKEQGTGKIVSSTTVHRN